MSESTHLNQIVNSIQKGIDEGFSEHHIISRLEQKGHKRTDIEMAIRIIKEPTFSKNSEKESEDIEKKKEMINEAKKKSEVYNKIIKEKKTNNKNSFFYSLKDTKTLFFIIVLCGLFFILGIILDKLIILIK